MGRLQFMNQDGEWESFPTEANNLSAALEAAVALIKK